MKIDMKMLKKALKTKKITQVKLAERFGVSQAELSNILAGKRKGVSEERLSLLVEMSGLSLEVLTIPTVPHLPFQEVKPLVSQKLP
jgi:transcriptional regulator with XRE-family HTH domain